MNFLAGLEGYRQFPVVTVLFCLALTGLVGFADFVLGYEIGFSVFYVLPIALCTWLTNRRLGLLLSVAGALVWYWADTGSGHPYSNSLIPIWNALIRLSFFVIITWLVTALRQANERERNLARIDNLTGAVNSRFFYDLARMESDRLQRYRHPFTLAYLDLDNFKTVNDQFGHPVGDQVLCIVVQHAQRHLRRADVVVRLGGDEFALLLPETNAESARLVLSKLQESLLNEMRRNHWPITFSMGVLTCTAAPQTIDQLVKLADDLMYTVKREGKNAIKYDIYAG